MASPIMPHEGFPEDARRINQEIAQDQVDFEGQINEKRPFGLRSDNNLEIGKNSSPTGRFTESAKASVYFCIEGIITEDRMTVADTGPALPKYVLIKSLNYSTRISSNAAYISPSREYLGNELKCPWNAGFAADRLLGRADDIVYKQIKVSVDCQAQDLLEQGETRCGLLTLRRDSVGACGGAGVQKMTVELVPVEVAWKRFHRSKLDSCITATASRYCG